MKSQRNPMIPDQSQIVIIGGGVIGTSVAWHLGQLGLNDVVLLERGQLGCGTSWHAAGNVASMDAQRSRTEILRYSGELYAQFEQHDSIGYRRCGRVMPARTRARMKEYESIAEVARTTGLNVELLQPHDVEERIPVMRVDDLVGGIWSAGDGRVNPSAPMPAVRVKRAFESSKTSTLMASTLNTDGSAACARTKKSYGVTP
jgi:glycine/D-amino acid oxidase-like deaminating enzyme